MARAEAARPTVATAVPDATRSPASAPSAAKARVIAAAQALFARHGVGGTSLQMIADELGVTKAAVYHQYRTKEEIVLAAAEAELAQVEAVITRAEAQRSARAARDVLVGGMVELSVVRRHTVGGFLTDPAVTGYFVHHPAFRQTMARLHHLLVGEEARPEASVRVALLIAALSGAATHPLVVDLDDDVLRSELSRLARRFLDPAG